MLHKFLIAVALAALAGSPAMSAQCRDAKGKFIKCPEKSAPAPKRCKDAKGKFAKCGTPGTRPA
jgi:hypothetical protein